MRRRIFIVANGLSVLVALAAAAVGWHPSGRGYTALWTEEKCVTVAMVQKLREPELKASEVGACFIARPHSFKRWGGFHYVVGECAFIGAGYVKAYDERYQVGVPLWVPIVLGSVLPVASAGRGIRRWGRHDLRASTERYPECGVLRGEARAKRVRYGL